jgi:hypothetical protein
MVTKLKNGCFQSSATRFNDLAIEPVPKAPLQWSVGWTLRYTLGWTLQWTLQWTLHWALYRTLYPTLQRALYPTLGWTLHWTLQWSLGSRSALIIQRSAFAYRAVPVLRPLTILRTALLSAELPA